MPGVGAGGARNKEKIEEEEARRRKKKNNNIKSTKRPRIFLIMKSKSSQA